MHVRVSRARSAVVMVAALTVIALVAAAPAGATFPGLNGKIVAGYEFEADWGLRTVNPDGSGVALLPGGDKGWNPSYSADGSQIAFEKTDGLYVIGADGGAPHKIAHSEWDEDWEVTYDDEFVRPDTEEEITVRVSTWSWSSKGIGYPAFLPDNQTVAAIQYHRWEKEIGYCAVEEVGDEECIEFGEPDAYFDYDDTRFRAPDLVVAVRTTDGAIVSQLAGPLEGALNQRLGVAPDGRIAISYESPSDSGSYLYVIPAGGGTPQKLAGAPVDARHPSFSPDGSKIIATVSWKKLAIIPVAGGAYQSLDFTPPPGTDEVWVSTPTFSPDGTKIAFGQEFWSAGGDSSAGIYVANLDATGQVKVLDWAYSPSWQSLSPPPPPPVPPVKVVRAKAIAKKQVRLDRKGGVVLGTLRCGSSPCKLKVNSAKLKIGKKQWSVKLTTPKKLAAGKSAKVKLKVAGKALAALKKAGKGKLTAKIQVNDAAGRKVLTFKPTVKGPPAKRGKKTAKR